MIPPAWRIEPDQSLWRFAGLNNRNHARRMIDGHGIADDTEEHEMMQDMMTGDAMMWTMGIGGLLVVVTLVLAIAALVKYVFLR